MPRERESAEAGPGSSELEAGLLHLAREGRVTRRQLVERAAGLGLSASAISAVLAACGGDDEAAPSGSGTNEGEGQRGGVVQLALGAGTLQETLDPATTAGAVNNIATRQIAQTLLELDPDTWEPTPGIAEWETNADASQWTLVMREGVEWHDGKPLTAQDAAYTIGRHLDEEIGSALLTTYQPYLDPDGIEVVDERTLRLNLKAPNAFFYLALGMHRAQVIQDGTTEFDTLVGTGPFRVKSFSPGRSFDLDRNPGYWEEGLPLLDGVRAVSITEVAGQVRAVVSGDSHIATDVDFTAAEEADQNDDVEVIFKESEQCLPIVLDVSKEPFDDQRVRDALKLAVNRQQVVDTAFRGHGQTGNDFPAPPSDTAFYPPDAPPPEQNVEEARRLLADAGHPNGIELTLLASEAAAAMMDEAIVFAESVAEAGFRMQVKQVPTETYWDQVWLVEPFYVANWNRRHAWQFLTELFRTNAPWNESKIKVPKIDELLDEAARTPALEEQREPIWEALAIVRDQAGWIVPGWVHQLYLTKKEVSGIEFGVLAGLDLRRASLS